MHTLATKIFTRYPRKSLRALEIIPPLSAIFLISMPFWGSIFFPVQLAYFILFFDVYWLYQSANLAYCAFVSSRKIKAAEKADWLGKAAALSDFPKMRHIVIIPTYQESISKIKETIDSIRNQTFNTKHIYIFLAFEARETNAKEKSEQLSEDNEDTFGALYSTFHPDNAFELKGKSSNQAYAARFANEVLVENKKLNPDFLTVSSVDADAIFDKQFFACLTYKFLTSKNPHLTFFQSANVTYNNFWQVPSFIRIIAFFGSLWRIALLIQGMRLIPNSVYSLSFRLLKQIDYWDTDVIPEDYRIFFKAFFRNSGRVAVEPIFLKTSMDSPRSSSYFKSLLNKYNQERRWSWGISDDAVYLKWWLLARDVPFFKKTYLLWNVLLDHILWPVNWYIITISANLIAFLNPVFTRTNLGYSLPQMSGFILTLCLFALFILIYVDFDMRSKNSKVSRFRQFIFPLEFVLMPISGFFLSSLPALISHVQLIIGKRLEYHVTEKS